MAALEVAGPGLLVAAPDDTTAVFGGATYSRSRGKEMVLSYSFQRMSDVADEALYRWSQDNGRTWSEAVSTYDKFNPSVAKPVVLPSGPRLSGYVNPFRRERLLLSASRVRPEEMDPDVPETYWKQTAMAYAISTDDGRTAGKYRPLVSQGAGFTEEHPFTGLYLGKNQVYGLHRALFLDRDTVLIPVELSVLGQDGKVYNPHGWDFSQVVVLTGRRKLGRYAWGSSQPVLVDALKESTRGMNEPTLARLADGRILMVMRGSNSFIASLPSCKWTSFSADQGNTWSHPQPWTYDDGTRFFSPSSISHLARHSSGRLFWFGNICSHNADGNSPRYPLVVGEVDPKTGLLEKSSVTTVADRAPDQSPAIQFSNFEICEDRVTHDFVLDMCHFYPSGKQNRRVTGPAWTGGLYRYRITLGRPGSSR